ncbi:hypothetical protein A9Q81_22970 [Gammaproteobacteria bacterium 42_54_T18]|nr:hypothetical protein A9Q81_22970 [Gammaproteobacteria bacterium 42_54_T18]
MFIDFFVISLRILPDNFAGFCTKTGKKLHLIELVLFQKGKGIEITKTTRIIGSCVHNPT